MIRSMGIYTTITIEEILNNARENSWTKTDVIDTISDIWDKMMNEQYYKKEV